MSFLGVESFDHRRRPSDDTIALLLAAIVLVAIVAMRQVRWEQLGAAFGDTDDAMRLVQVRDWLAGQPWFDLQQHRMGNFDSEPMHWSRLVDLPIAVIIRLGAVFVALDDAERIAMLVWPLLLYAATMGAVYFTGASLAGPWAGTVAVGLFASQGIVSAQFISGRIDHHNVQICLCAIVLAAAVRSSRSSAAVAGCVTAVLLAVGLEAIVVVAVVAAAYAMRFALEPVEAASRARAFAVALMVTSVVLFVGLVPSSRWSVSACDAMAANYLAAIVVGSIGLTVATISASRDVGTRACAIAVTGLTALAVFLVLEPACLRGPMALVPADVKRQWLDHVQEMQSVSSVLVGGKRIYLVNFAAALLGLVAAAYSLRIRGGHVTAPVLTLYAGLLLTMICGLLHLRLVMYAQLLAAIVLATETRHLAERRIGGLSPLALTLLTLLIVNAVPRLLGSAVSPTSASATISAPIERSCNRVDDYAALGKLPPARVVSFIDIGAFILASTPHSVLAAPYHRESLGIQTIFNIMSAEPATGRDLARRSGARYVALCSGSPEAQHHRRLAPRGFAASLMAGHLPEGMSRIGTEGPVLLFRLWPDEVASGGRSSD